MTRPHYTRYTTRDNGGVHQCYSINRTDLVGPFGRVLVSVTRCAATAPGGAKRFHRGDLASVVVTGRRCWVTRRGGVGSSLGYNGVIPLKKDASPVATRVYGVVYLEARLAGYTRLAVLAKALV